MGERGKRLHCPELHQTPSFVNIGTLTYEDPSLQTQTLLGTQIGLFLLDQFLSSIYELWNSQDGKKFLLILFLKYHWIYRTFYVGKSPKMAITKVRSSSFVRFWIHPDFESILSQHCRTSIDSNVAFFLDTWGQTFSINLFTSSTSCSTVLWMRKNL